MPTHSRHISSLAVLAVLLALAGSDAALARDGFLSDGGSITTVGTSHRGRFLDDGGSIRDADGISVPVEVRRERDRPFLEDGGSITSSGVRVVRYGERAYWDLERPRTFLENGGSITVVHDIEPVIVRHRGLHRRGEIDDRSVEPDGIAYRGVDEGDGRSIVVVPAPAGFDGEPRYAKPSGLKIIDVQSARLDRIPVGPDGIQIIHAGGAKIIRLKPGYKASEQRLASGETGSDAVGRVPQPWSQGWLDYCLATYASFDPDYGTYTDADGTSRFCEARE